jgi:hypothetical protein
MQVLRAYRVCCQYTLLETLTLGRSKSSELDLLGLQITRV